MIRCSVCSDAQGSEASRWLTHGSSVRSVAKAFGFSKSAVSRHKLECLNIRERPEREPRRLSRTEIREWLQPIVDKFSHPEHPITLEELERHCRECLGMVF